MTFFLLSLLFWNDGSGIREENNIHKSSPVYRRNQWKSLSFSVEDEREYCIRQM